MASLVIIVTLGIEGNVLELYYTSFSLYCKGGSELCRCESQFVKTEDETRFESLSVFSKNLILKNMEGKCLFRLEFFFVVVENFFVSP